MKEWGYNAQLHGETYSSIIKAPTKEDASQTLERMGFKNIMINDVVETKRAIEASRTLMTPPSISTNVNDTIEGLSKHVQNITAEEKQNSKEVIGDRRESIVFGDKKEALAIAETYLVKNGNVKHAIMRPDHTGKMSFLFVIEHDSGV